MIVQAKNLRKSFKTPQKVTLFTDIDLLIPPQTSTAIKGRSGEGKTTLLHILGALESFDSGSLQVCGLALPSPQASLIRNEKIGFIFQNYNLLDDFTTLENVLMPARIARKSTTSGSHSHSRALSLLEQVGLLDRAHFPAKLLSGGEKQRAAIARALCNNPDLILADEPSGNLDHTSSQIIHNLLLDTVRSHKKTLILVTHEDELAKACDQCYVLAQGKLVLNSSFI